jgi:hypothetical protein
LVLKKSGDAAFLDSAFKFQGLCPVLDNRTPDVVPWSGLSLGGVCEGMVRVVVLPNSPFQVIGLAAVVATGGGASEDVDVNGHRNEMTPP